MDELRCLDLRLRRQILKQQTHAEDSGPLSAFKDPLSAFKGVVITEAEVSDLLASSPARAESAAGRAGQQTLEQALRDLEDEIQARRGATLQAGMQLSLPRLAE
ncbi:MAG TPA: hypothetical protein VFQ87_04210, partial [Bradyrhizobium sp.]|nr:hypothetical protein [Bradyrhizobium sp.]